MVISKNKFVNLFFIIFILIGIFAYNDYGISWDEPITRTVGQSSTRYAIEKIIPSLQLEDAHLIPWLYDFKDKDYGPAFEMPLFLLERFFGLTQAKDVYQFRHLVTFFAYSAGVMALYLLAIRRYGNWKIGLLAAAFLIFSPRFFAEGFYNSKDIVFMSAFMIATNTMIAYLCRPNYKALILHAFATAFAVDIRIMGVLLVASTITALLIQVLKKKIDFRFFLMNLACYLLLTIVFVVMMFPWLWNDPVGHFIIAFKNMSLFRWSGSVLYLGEFTPATNLPWHYSLVWIAITTPFIYLALFLVGSVGVAIQTLKCGWRLWSDDNQMQDLIFLGLFAAPILAVIVLHSVLYDGWRQLYFVYPFLLLIAMHGLVSLRSYLANYPFALLVIYLTLAVSLVMTARWMYKNHPYQNVYFNFLVKKPIRENFELDYWGLSNRRALEFILSHDESPKINVAAGSWTPLEFSGFMLTAKDRERINLVSTDTYPHYLITNYRGVPAKDDAKVIENYRLVHQIKVDKEAILSIYRSNRDN